jgi:predicted O-methyltransferase YrrM
MFYLLLESAYIYGNLSENTEFLVYTSTEFMKKIKKSHLFSEKIKFEINDTYDTIDKSCKSRLDLFNLKSVNKYNKILYLDIDIIIKDDIQKVFDLAERDVIYALEEGTIDSHLNTHGTSLFGNEVHNYVNKSAFSSGIMLFKNCERIHFLFDKILEDMTVREHNYHDQPFIVYNAFKYNSFDNQILKKVAMNHEFNSYNVNIDKTIHHFPGCPGKYDHKMHNMTQFLNYHREATINNHIKNTMEYINEHLLPIIYNCGELLEGNIFMIHNSLEYTDRFLNKVKNISKLVLSNHVKKVMEIGFNSGFSTLLMLLSNPNITLTCFDLGEHSYTLPCYEKLKETFGDRIQLIIGDSIKTLKNIDDRFDIIHIDGGHSTEVAESDIIQSHRLSLPGSILIMNDYDFGNLHELWDRYIYIYHLKELDIQLYNSPHHDIKFIERL